MDKRRRRWTAKELDFLKVEALKGTPMKEISMSLDRTIRALRSAMSSLKIRRPQHWTPEDDQVLLQMLTEGATVEAVALRLGRRVKAVEGRWMRTRPAASIMKPPDRTPENDSLLLKMHMEGVPFEDIALRLGRSVTAVERR